MESDKERVSHWFELKEGEWIQGVSRTQGRRDSCLCRYHWAWTGCDTRSLAKDIKLIESCSKTKQYNNEDR